ncbi:hypothetical protein KG088_15550 [Halomonas sp. TRM85114]|uniref:hypothetical protein n=1 Tax=Halomonas jincaotanensis TaxID=2810616 RepID=UPI001BD4908D|nr:hypothetical protein [Halomonas jincaotanensis]MBS9405039.1 hypothetical protein [Halomonas jincaotanensis]
MQTFGKLRLSVLSLSFSAIAHAGPPCFPDIDSLPEEWRPGAEVAESLDPKPWSPSEAQDAVRSIWLGVEEMIALYERNPAAAEDLWEDSVASLIEVTYSSANDPELDRSAREAALRNLSRLLSPYLDRTPDSMDCDEYEDVVPLAVYAHTQLGPDDPHTGKIVDLTNAALRDCEPSLEAAMGIDYQPVLDGTDETDDEEVFDLVIWSLIFIEAQTVPGLETTEEMRAFAPALWEYLKTYPLDDVETFEDGAEDEDFIDQAYLATHIAYIPTGNHRFPLYVEDSPRLFDYHRRHFYPVLEMGELDLVAEFVDSLRQYGCTPENDVQVRDGTRYLLDVFHAGDDSWMAYRETGETDDDVDSYDLIHKAWTGVLGVRGRAIEPAEPGTYGGVVRSWLPAPH